MLKEMDPLTLIRESRPKLETLLRDYQVVRLEMFGSAVSPHFDPSRSDLDFLVEFAPGTDLGPWLGRFFELREALTALLGRPVDLVSIRALDNPSFRQQVEHTRSVVYAG